MNFNEEDKFTLALEYDDCMDMATALVENMIK